MPKQIMYIGRKPTKVDNKNNVHSRVWRGLGQVITNIPDLEAQKLADHPDIWKDVTGMSAADRAELIAAHQEQYRLLDRRDREGQVLTLDNATDEELEATLKKRKSTRGKAVVNPVDRATLGAGTSRVGSMGNERPDEAERPANVDDLGADIYGAISALSREKDYDEKGQPYLERVNEKLGYTITQQELNDVWAAFKSKE